MTHSEQAEPPFWVAKSLDQLSRAEWEALCDGCGLCCLHKLEDEDDGSVYYTRIACRLLDLHSARCQNYPGRQLQVPDCVCLTPDQAEHFNWLPITCAYRLRSQGQPLPDWHHLVCGDPEAVHRAGISRLGHLLAESAVPESDWEDYLIFRSG